MMNSAENSRGMVALMAATYAMTEGMNILGRLDVLINNAGLGWGDTIGPSRRSHSERN
jgi:NAD(P)-dependent dehydrogenase (short-subunit alcohol dehydrogenase family)